MRRKWWIGPVAALAAFLVANVVIAMAPGPASRTVKTVYHNLPEGVRSVVPDEAEQALGRSLDEAARFYALGDADRLAETDVRLEFSEPDPNRWHSSRELLLEWTDLSNDAITYEVLAAPVGAGLGDAATVATSDEATGRATLPGDGRFDVWIRPHASGAGHASHVGEFWVDATVPPAPALSDVPDPEGYSFELAWTGVEDTSSIDHYELERSLAGTLWERVATTGLLGSFEDQIGNGVYDYRVRAVNGAALPSAWSASVRVEVRAPLGNPGAGDWTYGVHANYTGFLYLWDLSDPSRYLGVDQVPAPIRDAFTAPEPGIETENGTLQDLVAGVVASEGNTLLIAKKLFEYLYDHTDYDSDKLTAAESRLQRAGETLDTGKGICGDLAVLYITMLRIAGVPARPVHGYLDNTRSGIGGFHMWVEVYVGPVEASHPWMTVDVSGVTGAFEPDDLFPYFGILNPDYLALGTELDYDRDEDQQWNTWASYVYQEAQDRPDPDIEDRTRVTEYEREDGRLYFDVETRRTRYVACEVLGSGAEDLPCGNEPGLSAFDGYYAVKGVSKKRIDYGYEVNSELPRCLRVDLRYPKSDAYGAVTPDQSVLYKAYENSASPRANVQVPGPDGWVVFRDGTSTSCAL